jgi:hypothetical protein
MTTPDLATRAAALYPGNARLQQQWLAAVTWLRECSKIGFALDGRAEKIVSRTVLHGYCAPLPVMQTIIELPDEQIMPGVVRLGRRAK